MPTTVTHTKSRTQKTKKQFSLKSLLAPKQDALKPEFANLSEIEFKKEIVRRYGSEIVRCGSESPLREIYYRKTPADAVTRNHLPPHEIERLLEELKKHSPGYLYPLIKFFVETGAKVTEVVDLKWNQLDCVKRSVHFPGTDRSQSRTVTISEELAGILSKRQKETGVVFKTYYREPFTRIKITRAINEFKTKGLYRRPWNLLDLRHSFAMNFLSGGGSMRELQYLMGHENIFNDSLVASNTLNSIS